MNELKRIDDFRKVLADYGLSESAKSTLQQIKLVLLVGPTSAGRNTIIEELLRTGKYHYIVSDTTRQKRMNNGQMEQDGREYWFRTEEDLLNDLQQGEFLEAAIIHNQQVSGISMRELNAAQQEGKIAINEIEIVGADNIYRAKPDTTFIFVIPPSFDEWLRRMQGRGKLPADEIRRRLESACLEFEAALQHSYYNIVVNEDFTATTQQIRDIVEASTPLVADQADARKRVEALLAATREHLASGSLES